MNITFKINPCFTNCTAIQSDDSLPVESKINIPEPRNFTGSVMNTGIYVIE